MKTAKPAGSAGTRYSASLSSREVRLLAGWERERRSVVSLDDIRRAVGSDAASDVARRLVRKTALERVGPGRFVVRPLRALTRPATASAVVLAAAALQGKRYYLGGLWALTFHRLTGQQFTSVIDAFVTRRAAARELGHARLVFHRVSTRQLAYGVTAATIEGVSVRVSDPERTLLDLLDLPSLGGGAGGSLRHVQQALPHVSKPKLIEHAVRGSRSSTCQRLGLLLDRAGVSQRRLAPLRRRIRTSKSMLSLVSGAPRVGPFNRRWNVVENDA